MQHEAFANTEDFGGPDIVAGPGRVSRPGADAPYTGYELGKPYDEEVLKGLIRQYTGPKATAVAV